MRRPWAGRPYRYLAGERRHLGTLRAAPTTPFAVGVRQYNWMRGSRQVTTFVYYPAAGTPGGSPVTNAPVARASSPLWVPARLYAPARRSPGANPPAGRGRLHRPRPQLAQGRHRRRLQRQPGPGQLGSHHPGTGPETDGDPLAGHIDTTAGLGMSGYSMGGMTTNAMLTTYPDPRITAAIPMACIDMGNPSSMVKANVLFRTRRPGQHDPAYSSARQAYA